jgi:hypothetical protein
MPAGNNGIAPYLLNDLKSAVDMSYPGSKVDLKGFLAMLTSGPGAQPIQQNTLTGNKKTVTFWYRQRPTLSMTDTAAACDQLLTPARLETTVSVANVRQIAYHLTDELVASYTEEAAQRMANPGVPFSGGATNEMMDIIYSACNALLTGINRDLMGLLTWGKNKVSGSNAAVTLNIPQTLAQNLGVGMPKLLSDYKMNNLMGTPNIVGAGLMYNYILTQPYKATDSIGMNSQIATAGVNFFPDQDFASVVGTDNIGVFEPGSIQLVEYLEYTGFKAGVKPGDSEFGVLVLPATDTAGNIIPVKVDFQLRYLPCATTLYDAYSGNSTSFAKGWSLILKKNFGLFQLPSDAYRNDDGNIAVNGSLRYNVTNS